ncbi:MAG: hypothetical protein JWM34_3653 [Ilumatobacteraceae bacterium]|nr:hypothetical protein [Ilumatobacteraceae bacterium]
MSATRLLSVVAVGVSLSLLVVACSNDRDGTTSLTTSTTTSTVLPTTTIVPTTVPVTTVPVTEAPTTLAPTTTSTVAPTTTEAPSTTTTPPGASLSLRFDGVGEASFGTSPDDVITYVSNVLGRPTADTGWVNAGGVGCSGGQARIVFWNDLRLTFGDSSNISSERRHFFAWRYGPPGGTSIDPEGMTTITGLTVGSSVTDLQKAYPAATLVAGDATNTPSAKLSDGLLAFLTDTSPTGVVTAILGGQNCTD